MGIYDRDYYQRPSRGFVLRRPSSMVIMIIIANVAFYLANGLLTGGTNALTYFMSVHLETLLQPWMWWQFLSYGFAHAPYPDVTHVLFNMLGLFFLGRDVEERYGSAEFLRIYLLLVIVGGVVWNILNLGWASFVEAPRVSPVCMGASGAVVGVVVLFAMNFPRRTLLLWGVLPMPAWVLGVMIVLFDVFGATQKDSNIAHSVHLTGAAVAFLYFRNRWNLGHLVHGVKETFSRSRPSLKVHDPDRGGRRREGDDPTTDAEVDAILQKYSEHGPDSLTARERKVLEKASRRYQKKHGNRL